MIWPDWRKDHTGGSAYVHVPESPPDSAPRGQPSPRPSQVRV